MSKGILRFLKNCNTHQHDLPFHRELASGKYTPQTSMWSLRSVYKVYTCLKRAEHQFNATYKPNQVCQFPQGSESQGGGTRTQHENTSTWPLLIAKKGWQCIPLYNVATRKKPTKAKNITLLQYGFRITQMTH